MATSAIAKIADTSKQPKIVERLPDDVPWAPNGASMVVSTPWEVNAIISSIPAGKLLTITEIREFLAQKHHTDIACPVSTGIFINIVARAAQEMRSEGKRAIAPYWRVLRADGSLNPKYPDGAEGQQRLLETEGYHFTQKGKKILVDNYQQALWDIVL